MNICILLIYVATAMTAHISDLKTKSNYADTNLNLFNFGLRKNCVQKGINYEPKIASKRPKNWELIRGYRMKRREQLLLLAGSTKEEIEESQFSRYKQVR